MVTLDHGEHAALCNGHYGALRGLVGGIGAFERGDG
jgi:hypothetical protein